MELYLRILKYLAPAKHQIVLTVVVSLLTSIFSVVSIYTILPLLKTVFEADSPKTEIVEPIPAQSDSENIKQSQTKPEPAIQQPGDVMGSFDTDAYKEKIKTYFNEFLEAGSKEETLLNICLFLVITFLLKNFFLYLNNQLIIRIQTKAAKKLRDEVFSKILNMPLAYFNENRVGTLMNYVHHEVSVVNNAISSTFVNIVRNPFMVIFYVIVLLFISWKLTAFAFLISLISLVGIQFIGKKIRRYAVNIQSRLGNINSRIQEVFNGIKLVKTNAMEDRESKNFKLFTNDLRRTELKAASLRGVTGPLNETLGISAIVLALWFGGMQVFKGDLSSLELIVFAFALFSIMSPIKSIAESYTKIQGGIGSAKRLFQILDTESNMKNGTRSVDAFNSEITLENVFFRYHKDDPDADVLKDISVKIKKGQTVAFVGSSGSGKSTLVDLILRFYDVDKGSIKLDGTDIREFDIAQYRKIFGVVSQEVILFNDTISGNIAYGSPKNYESGWVEEAAKLANAHNFIQEAPEKYKTNIGDRGLRLSGGQRQRLSIARAMMKNPPILIFDEATSALDNESEKIVQEAIDQAMENRTSIVIAHRLSTIKNADKIVVLDCGAIVETGHHEELLAKGGIYKRLYNMQFQDTKQTESI